MAYPPVQACNRHLKRDLCTDRHVWLSKRGETHLLHVNKVADALGDEVCRRRVQASADLVLQHKKNTCPVFDRQCQCKQ